MSLPTIAVGLAPVSLARAVPRTTLSTTSLVLFPAAGRVSRLPVLVPAIRWGPAGGDRGRGAVHLQGLLGPLGAGGAPQPVVAPLGGAGTALLDGPHVLHRGVPATPPRPPNFDNAVTASSDTVFPTPLRPHPTLGVPG